MGISTLVSLSAGTVDGAVRVNVFLDAWPMRLLRRSVILSGAGGCLAFVGRLSFSGSKRSVTSAFAASRLTSVTSGTDFITSRKSASRSAALRPMSR